MRDLPLETNTGCAYCPKMSSIFIPTLLLHTDVVWGGGKWVRDTDLLTTGWTHRSQTLSSNNPNSTTQHFKHVHVIFKTMMIIFSGPHNGSQYLYILHWLVKCSSKLYWLERGVLLTLYLHSRFYSNKHIQLQDAEVNYKVYKEYKEIQTHVSS